MLTISGTGAATEALLSNSLITVRLAPGRGMNLEALHALNADLILPEEARCRAGQTYGAALLYPTPNRVRDGLIRWGDGSLSPGRNHGFARHQVFTPVQATETEEGGVLAAELCTSATSPWYPQCPFTHRLLVRLTLTRQALQWSYAVQNQDEKPFPYSIGIHPFFQNPALDASLQIDADQVLRRNRAGDYLPEYQGLGGTPADFRAFRAVAGASLNDAFRVRSTAPAILRFRGGELHMTTSREFRYVVVYTYQERCFCVECQTGAPDAHFLHAQGFPKEAALVTVQPGQTRRGFLRWSFVPSSQQTEKRHAL